MGYNYKDVKGKKNPNYKTGLKCRDSKEVGIYNTWCNLKQRCLNKKNPKYHMYGGRGIKVCDEWMKIETLRQKIKEINKIIRLSTQTKKL